MRNGRTTRVQQAQQQKTKLRRAKPDPWQFAICVRAAGCDSTMALPEGLSSVPAATMASHVCAVSMFGCVCAVGSVIVATDARALLNGLKAVHASQTADATPVSSLVPPLSLLRRWIHAHPEPGFEEATTAAVVVAALQHMGVPPQGVCGVRGAVAWCWCGVLTVCACRRQTSTRASLARECSWTWMPRPQRQTARQTWCDASACARIWTACA